MKHLVKREEGQSILIIAGGLVVLVALMALVVDAGNAYQQRRQMQNAVDAGSQAGSIALAQAKPNGAIVAAIRQYVSANGVDPNQVQAYYVVQDANGNDIPVTTNTIDAYGLSNPAPTTLNVNGVNLPVVGVQVQGDKTFNTFFAGVVGFKQMTVDGGSSAYAQCGACSASGLFPIALNSQSFIVNGQPAVYTEQSSPDYTYTIFENKQTGPGNFGYVSWNNDPSEPTLVNNMNNPQNSGTWLVGQSVPGATGTMASSGERSALQSYLNKIVTIPVYDTTAGQGNNLTYHIVGFASFRITCFKVNSQVYGTCQGDTGKNDKFIQAKLQQTTDSAANGGCASFGICTVKVRPPIAPQRALVGTVKLLDYTQTNSTPASVHIPVDVVSVLDVSSSMSWDFNGNNPGSNQKINAAKTALTNFDQNMQPTKGDQLGLVSFPAPRTYGSQYHTLCPNSNINRNPSITYYETAQVQANLSGNVAAVNSAINGLSVQSNTPTASAIQMATQMLNGSYHKSGNVKVMILATDGRANVLVANGKYDGDNADFLACNDPAVQDMIDQANIAKNANNQIIVFVIAIGNDANSTALKAVATPDSDPSKPHYFVATDPTSMANIYQQIANRVQNIGGEGCQIIQTEGFAPGANLVVKNTTTGISYNVQTTSTGAFSIPNVDAGTFVFQSGTVVVNGLTYNIFTDSLGGPPSTSSPSITVPDADGTYTKDLFLGTSQPPTCH